MSEDPTTRVPVDEHEAHTYSFLNPFTALISVIFGAFQVLLVIRFILKLGGAIEANPLVAGVYGVTEPLVRPFQGIFPQPEGPFLVEIAAILAIVFLVLVHALILAIARAVSIR